MGIGGAMEILDPGRAMARAQQVGQGARMAQLHPAGNAGQALLAVDLLEVEPGGATSLMQHMEEHVLYVIAGTGELSGDGDAPAALLRPDSLVYVSPREPHRLRNTGRDTLRVLVSTPLLVRSDRQLGVTSSSVDGQAEEVRDTAPAQEPVERLSVRERPERPQRPAPEPAPVVPTPTTTRTQPPEPEAEVEAPPPDISGLMRKASDLVGEPRPERRRPAPEPEPEPQPEPVALEGQEDEADEGKSELMELHVVFDGGSRGNPGQGYGSYLVQSPGRRPVVKRVEFGDNYTNNQAEYDSLINALQYIIERLTVTNRTPAQVALDIKADSDLVVNQLQGNYKVKDAGLKSRYNHAVELLEQFGAWVIEWHPREESVRLLGH